MKKHLQNILTFVIIFLIVNLVFSFFFKPGDQNQQPQNTITLTPIHTDFEVGSTVSADLKNDTPNPITLKNNCPNEPLNVLEQVNGQWVQKHKAAQISCEDATDIVINPGEKHTITFANWNHALFSEVGNYKVQAVVWVQQPTDATAQTQQTGMTESQQAMAAVGTTQSAQSQETAQSATGSEPQLVSQIVESNEFQIKPQGIIGWIWITIFYQPIYNSLIFIMSLVPGHGLGLGIILLTILIRTILLIPNQKALVAQRKMQDVQPKLDKIREKYKDNQEMIGKETLAVMQEHKVNPLGSCLPMLIQFPLLIALYYVVKDGLNPDNAYLLYDGLKNFDYNSISVIFLGILDLTKINTILLPLFVGGLQFTQMKLAFARTKKNQTNDNKPAKKTQMDTASNMMLYFMPVMIAIFTASVPAGVGIYWSASTAYGIIQQLFVNKQAEKEHVKVRVVEKT